MATKNQTHNISLLEVDNQIVAYLLASCIAGMTISLTCIQLLELSVLSSVSIGYLITGGLFYAIIVGHNFMSKKPHMKATRAHVPAEEVLSFIGKLNKELKELDNSKPDKNLHTLDDELKGKIEMKQKEHFIKYFESKGNSYPEACQLGSNFFYYRETLDFIQELDHNSLIKLMDQYGNTRET